MAGSAFIAVLLITSLTVAWRIRQQSVQAVAVYRLAEPPVSAEEARTLLHEAKLCLERRAHILRKSHKVSRVTVSIQNDDRVVVNFATLDDPRVFARKLMRLGLLELRLVEPYMAAPDSEDEPPGYVWLTLSTWQFRTKPAELVLENERLLVKRQPELTIRKLGKAKVTRVMPRPPIFALDIEFTPEDAVAFERTTARCLNQRLAAVVDNEVLTAPEVDGVISGGRVRIVPFRDHEEANRIAALLQCGALPAPLEMESFHTGTPR